MERHIINENLTIIEALGRLNELSGEAMALMVTDNDGKMTGSLTDGDIRRALLAGSASSDPVSQVMHRDFAFVREGSADLEVIADCRRRGIRLLPALDECGRIVRLVDLTVTKTILPLSALIMAGGRGERLRPLTLTTPKPLLEVGGKPIIDYNVEALRRCGIDDIAVSVNYLGERIKEHFSGWVPTIRCVEESAPLGTIGALGSVKGLHHEDVMVMNSDLLTDISFEEMYVRHRQEGADITIAAIPYNLSVPYAILHTEGQRVKALEEKPVYSYYANAGIYIIGKSARNLIKEGERMDATDLIDNAIAEGMKVVYFPIDGTWIDIGTPADYRHACDIMKYRKN